MLGVVQLGGATGFFPEDVIDVFENLLEAGGGVGGAGCGPGGGLGLGCGDFCGVVGVIGEGDGTAPASAFGDFSLVDQGGLNAGVGVILPAEFGLEFAVTGGAAECGEGFEKFLLLR
ncbi:hypothetical protein [Acidiphilium rubrum]|uniref:hypothetical protein n=1 Tax=Acidiphilium rubrum TaxID=526 RepID=UPI002B5A5B34|nr:hypothetical protein [Acidiphilium rubrum]HQT86823.1 hypothetical protein [Acidiphilium rubrum]